jgi:Ca2+-transporting ATPase
VPADGVLVDGVNFTVDESTLTGEAVPVRKTAGDGAAAMGAPGGDATPWVFSGTLVVKGHGMAVIRSTGEGTELGRIGAALRDIDTERTALQREVDRLVRVIAMVGISVATAVVVVYGLVRGSWLEGLLAGIATAMAVLPEEFPVVMTVFLALGAWRMSQRHVLTRRPAVIETLGSATVVCVDKTGTLTLNQMTVQQLLVGDDTFVLADAPLPEAFHLVAEFAVLASPIDPFDPMDKAFRTMGDGYLHDTEHLHDDWTLVREYPLSEHLLALSHVWQSPDSTHYVVAAKGAAEAIVDLCHLAPAEAERVLASANSAATSGQRVLAVARASFEQSKQLPTEQHDFTFEFLGLTGLHDPLRPGVAEAVAECRRAGVRTVMITGDSPGTALAIAAQVGLGRPDVCITGPELAAMDDAELAERVRTTDVFARMVPQQKLQLVRALAANGEVVGMTGDGVNDAPALRAADIGIAMGARGTDVAREAAALVITDDDFTSIVGGIRQGRGIFDNLRKAMAYIIAVHVPIIGMSLLPLFVRSWPMVLLPVQIAFLELIIDPACSVVFEAEQIDANVMLQPPRRVDEPMFGGRVLGVAVLQGIIALVAVVAVYLWGIRQGLADDVIRSMSFATLVLSNLGLILVNRSWRLNVWRTFAERRNPALRWILGLTMVVLAAVLWVPWLRRVFGFGAISVGQAALAAVAAVAGVSWFEVRKMLHHHE